MIIMFEINVKYDEIDRDFPNILKKFLDEMNYSFKNYENIRLEDMNFFYYWTLYSESVDNDVLDMKYEDRIQYELNNRLVVEIYVKYKNYIRGETLQGDITVPFIIIDDLRNSMIKTMVYEQFSYGNKEVIYSIPMDDEITIQLDYDKEEEVDISEITIDGILDKINDIGFENLSEYEKNFLEEYKKSGE